MWSRYSRFLISSVLVIFGSLTLIFTNPSHFPSHRNNSCGYPFKRLFDAITAILLLVLLAPLIAIIAFVVRVTIGKPVLFRQMRPGLNGELFTLYKFRTMVDARDTSGDLLLDSQRLTYVGEFLRHNSLDELPELFNVLIGEMSLVGPRPLLMRYMPYYSKREQQRHTVRPGITGWAQINGRNELSWTERLELDVWYAENMSISLDLKILFKTIGKVLARTGVVVDARSIMLNLDEERADLFKEKD